MQKSRRDSLAILKCNLLLCMDCTTKGYVSFVSSCTGSTQIFPFIHVIVSGTYQTLTSRDLNMPVMNICVERLWNQFDIDIDLPGSYNVGNARMSRPGRAGNPRPCSIVSPDFENIQPLQPHNLGNILN